MTESSDATIFNRWKQSRSGAWAGRGFHYQHLFSVLILVRQWAGLSPTGVLVPEGQEDCVIELPDRDIWLQIKSRKEGTFSSGEVQAVMVEVKGKAGLVKNKKKIQFAVGLEKPCPEALGNGIDQLFESHIESILVCREPEKEIIALLTEQLSAAEIITDGIVSDLYKLVADASAANASLSFDKRRRISTTEIERRIFERLEAEDPSAIDAAFVSRALEPVDFVTPVSDPSFYQGVKAQPGHVSSGLILARHNETDKVITSLKSRRHVLIAGPSGAGKSALMWLSASALSENFRWFQVTPKAGAGDANSIVRFVRARRPNLSSPIALAFDEVGGRNCDLWDVLVRELRGLPDVYLLGAVRREDLNLIANHSDTEFVELSLDENIAQSIWEQLSNQNQTEWSHWREPFEQSGGLMLEYVHLLTQGARLAAVIGDQIRQRELEGRHDELAIIRSAAVLCSHGGEVEAKKLFALLDIPPERASKALSRLIDEHLLRESRVGVLGGLHALRSAALCKASHDEVVYVRAETLWKGILATTNETLPQLVQSVLTKPVDEDEALQNLSELLLKSEDIDVWTAILTGLGFATLEIYVAAFIDVLEQHEVKRAQWSLASMFVDPSIDLPDLSDFALWASLSEAVLSFRALPKYDLRADCLERIPEGMQVPPCKDLGQANRFLACLSAISGGRPIKMRLKPEFTGGGMPDIRDVAALLSTAYEIAPDMAEDLVVALGGEQTLLDAFHAQTPWTTPPTIDADGEHGRTVRSDWFLVSEGGYSDLDKIAPDICETLIAISPGSDAAASDVVDPLGQPIAIGEHRPWSKNMPRQNLPAKARVAWNVAFRQILLARAAADSLTDYSEQMAVLVQRTEKAFRSYTEKWIKGKSIANANALATEVNEITEKVNALAYAIPDAPAPAMTAPISGAGVDDTLGALLTGVLGNLVGRMSKVLSEGGAKSAAVFAGSLANQAREHEKSAIWRATSKAPLKELKVLASRLADISSILHEMAYDETQAAITRIVKAAEKGSMGKAIGSAARRCSAVADKRFQERLHGLEESLLEHGWTAKCWTRPVNECDSVYWPHKEVAILVDIDDFETDSEYIADCLSVGQTQLGNNWPYRIVPVVNGHVVAALAMSPSSHGPLPDLKFATIWESQIALPFLSSKISEAFDAAVLACLQVSSLILCRDGLKALHPVEADVLSKAEEVFELNRKIVSDIAEETKLDEFNWALAYLNDRWGQVIAEAKARRCGDAVPYPLCMGSFRASAGEENSEAAEFARARMLLRQAECRMAADGELSS